MLESASCQTKLDSSAGVWGKAARALAMNRWALPMLISTRLPSTAKLKSVVKMLVTELMIQMLTQKFLLPAQSTQVLVTGID